MGRPLIVLVLLALIAAACGSGSSGSAKRIPNQATSTHRPSFQPTRS